MNENQTSLAVAIAGLVVSSSAFFVALLQYLHALGHIQAGNNRKTFFPIIAGLIVLVLISALAIRLIVSAPSDESARIIQTATQIGTLDATGTYTSTSTPSITLTFTTTPTVTLTSTPSSTFTFTPRPDQADVIFEDDFTFEDLRDWQHDDGNSDGFTRVIDGELEMQSNSPSPRTLYTRGLNRDNYAIALSFSVSEASNDAHYGVIIRSVNECQYYYVRFGRIDANKIAVEIIKFLDCKGETVKQDNIALKSSDWHDINILITDPDQNDGKKEVIIVVMVDNNTINYSEDKNFIYSGRIGLRVENSTVHFDNVRIIQKK